MTIHRNYAHPAYRKPPKRHAAKRKTPPLARAAKALGGMAAAVVCSAIALIGTTTFAGQETEAPPAMAAIEPQAEDREPQAQAWLDCAVEAAADPSHGYSFDSDPLEPDAFCTSFVYACLTRCGAPLTSEAAVERGLLDAGLGGGDAVGDLRTQADVLEELGFERRRFDGFDRLPPGAVLYACTKNGSYRHVEFYLGRYDLGNLDEDGNPAPSADGEPLTIGARMDDNDPAFGDQRQVKPNCWLGGEVGAWPGYSRGKDYWTWALIPPTAQNPDKGA